MSNQQLSPCKNICNECIFHALVEDFTECLNPDELGVNCSTVVFCSSFQPTQQIDSPCVSFGEDNDEMVVC
ncbi:MAG: hypothetical protein HC785_03965 [Calothrix sp. CSU_2_0]|nr:hypothetical protein [Calothrix sp. CSU_2_0]